MALINCPECGKEISDKAASCPNCGYPINSMYIDEYEEFDDTYENEYEDYEEYEGEEISAEGVRHIYECSCICLNCGNEFSFNNVDVSKNKEGRWNDLASVYSSIGGSNLEKAISYNHQRQSYTMDFNRCPKCGSRKIKKEYSDYYINSNGEYLEDYEPSFSDNLSEKAGHFFSSLGDIAFKGCLLVSLIPLLLLLYAIYQIFSAVF